MQFNHFTKNALTLVMSQADPYQMNNLLLPLNEQGAFADWTSDVPGGRVASRLDAIMLYLKGCRGAACRYGWEVSILLQTHCTG